MRSGPEIEPRGTPVFPGWAGDEEAEERICFLGWTCCLATAGQ